MTSLFAFDNSFAREMEGFYVALDAERAPDPELLLLNEPLARELKLEVDTLRSTHGADVLSGNERASGSLPLAQAYAGHQFGGFSPSLGDGRALLLGEVLDVDGQRRDIQLKGSGRTPFSRNGDGKAALGPVLREYLIGEAMHALGIPTTRGLAVVATGDTVVRERPLPGAVLTRVASSHIRVGTFQFFAARGQTGKLRQLADYAITRHDPDLADSRIQDRYLRFLERVILRQARLVAQWMSVGFIHGVMNTDNMTISGETIDYGPCAFMDTYRPNTVFSSIDDFGRYAYDQQPLIAQWNLARLAECLLELIAPDDPESAIRPVTALIEQVPAIYRDQWIQIMRRKFGLEQTLESDLELATGFHQLLESSAIDFTLAFRRLAEVGQNGEDAFLRLFEDSRRKDGEDWLSRWQARSGQETTDPSRRMEDMQTVNPVYIPRNHLVEEALEAAIAHSEMAPFADLLDIVTHPFQRREDRERYETGAPQGSPPHVTFCGT